MIRPLDKNLRNAVDIPKTSAKMRIRIMPTNNLGCCAVPRTPASPTIPMANLRMCKRGDTDFIGADCSIPSCETCKADAETSTELKKSREKSLILCKIRRDQDWDDQAVDTNDTSHDNGDNVYSVLLVLNNHTRGVRRWRNNIATVPVAAISRQLQAEHLRFYAESVAVEQVNNKAIRISRNWRDRKSIGYAHWSQHAASAGSPRWFMMKL